MSYAKVDVVGVDSNIEQVDISGDSPNISQFDVTQDTQQVPAPPIVLGLYVSFMVNVHDASEATASANFIQIGGATVSDDAFAIWVDSAGFEFEASTGGLTTVPGVFTLNTWFTIDLRIVISMGVITATPRINGVQYADFSGGTISIKNIFFGAIASGSVNNHSLDNLLLGSTDWETSDFFSANFTSSIVPPFDSITGSGLSISGGTLLVSNAGTDAWATKAFIYP